MKYISILITTAFLMSYSVFSQDKISKHTVAKGETINQIAQKYKVTPYDIYKLNPDAQSGLKLDSVLLIPGSSGKTTNTDKSAATTGTPKKSNGTTTHEVVAKETLFGIEKKYNVSDEALKKANPFLEKDGLQIGQTLTIPSGNSSKDASKDKIPATKLVPAKQQDKYVYHDVLAKETKYSIAKQYGITVEELEKRNPEVVPNLPVGYRLTIKGTAPKIVAPTTTPVKNEVKTPVIETAKKVSYADYQVKPKETLYSLSKTFGLSQDELLKLNPSLSGGVQEGMILKVPAGIMPPPEIKSETRPEIKEEVKEVVTLTKKRSNDRKKIALLLPFNLSKIQSDTTSAATRLKKDKFLNMTLDFYSGALMAIDSAKVLGLPIDVSIFDSQETKSGSSVASIVQSNRLQEMDAVIGPFYQTNAEATAKLLGGSNVPVISPLSKDKGNPFDNLYQTIPSNDILKNAMFDYMRSKGGNIIAVVDKKKESIRQYIQQNQKGVIFAPVTEAGDFNPAGLKIQFVPNRMNYVVMETANTAMINATIKVLLSSMSAYQVQLVILEPNSTLDTDEVSFESLTKLKLMYPSVTRENESPGALIFEKEYRNKNKINPNTYATRGFDVTFDTMMRLSQGKTYEETASEIATEQVDNKFQFYKKEDGGYANKGVYILYYDSDLTIKEAN
ncbi:amino acid ABC transporter substrate-binding protein [Flavobacterium hydatis]|uniref:Peptidoglycan-binding protein n=1 Tax=Flavobacterium hydatis TaxID=991 RepID=A0A086A0F5_FLAHY|nr:LysM peptidoglycan-binding domain-containing protein [Flavobacterium hydatis]KFF10169.1 peptidoglycan-binding protein [Flavobacterium hydatis]OXA89501.1 peptidoglycan-binding protein [Flavobacterium hydatis]